MKFKYRYLRDSSGSGRDYIRLPLLQVGLGFGGNRTDVVGLVGLRLSRGLSYTGTSGMNILSEGGTLKKVVSLKP